MNDFFLTTAIIPRICFVILFAVAVAYLLSLKRKSAATWWLIAFCVGLALVDGGWDLPYAIPLTQMSPGVYHLVFLLGQGLFIPLGLAYVQFAYTFRGNPYPREARVLAWILGVLAVGVVLLIVFTPAYVLSPLLAWNQVGALMSMLFLSLWAAVVFLRKALRFSRDARALQADAEEDAMATTWMHLRRPHSRAARACRTFCGISLFFLLFTAGGGLAWALGIFEAVGKFLFIAGYLLFLYGMLVAYVNYAPEPTTVQVKLVGAALVTTLLIFVLLAFTLFGQKRMLAASGVVSPPPHTLRFEPSGAGGYAVTAQSLQMDPVLGDTLGLANDTVLEVMLPFDFPFYGQTWKTLYISDNSQVSMVPPPDIERVLTPWPFFHTSPFIAPLGIDLDPTQGGGVFYKATPETVTVTWYEMPLANGTHRHTAQLVLYPTGAMAMHYAAPGSGPVASELWQLGLRGLHPGGVNVPRQALPREPVDVLRSDAGVALLEDYATQVYAYQEEQGVPLFWFVISTALFILFVFPYLFRYSLLKPLERLLAGVRRVETGETDTVVAVEAEDEIGLLTQHFNGMTYAVHEAEAKLQAYAETLEDKVEARTAELARSLEELKATQAQLVQQEKMASLGALTAGIAHEIKNPLNFVNNFALLTEELAAELLQTAEANPDQPLAAVREDLDDLRINTTKIYKHGRRADGIVQAMMAHAHSSAGERRAIDLNALVEEYLNLAFHGMRAQVPDFNVTIKRDYDEAVDTIDVVPQDIGRVVLNLLNNAFYAVHQHSLSLNGRYTPTVRISTHYAGTQVEIRVTDNGPGIPDDIRAKIFEPFFTTKPTGSGTGLGLSLSYDIVTQGHGGTLTVESEEGHGAAFVVRLPASSSVKAMPVP